MTLRMPKQGRLDRLGLASVESSNMLKTPAPSISQMDRTNSSTFRVAGMAKPVDREGLVNVALKALLAAEASRDRMAFLAAMEMMDCQERQ